MPKKKRRRGNNDGSIFYRASKKRWYAQISVLGPDGKAKQVSRTAESREHAQQLLVELQSSNKKITPENARNLLAGEFLRAWLRDLASSQRHKETTQYLYEMTLNNKILPTFAGRLLMEIQPHDIREWLNQMTEAGEGLSVRAKAFSVFSAALNDARRQALIEINPCSQVKRPVEKRNRIHLFTEEEVNRILEAKQEDRLYAVYLLAFTCGLRQGEIFGLRWEDINYQQELLSIERQACELRGKVVVQTPKFDSKRTIHLPAACLKALQARQLTSMKEKTFASGFVFTNRNGKLICRSHFSRRHWKPLLEELQIEHRGMHNARHFAATTMLRRRVPTPVVSRLLGHKKTSVTTDIYSHFTVDDSAQASQAMSDFGSRNGLVTDDSQSRRSKFA